MQGSDTADLSSPWDLAWHAGRVVVAMAGIHQLWSFDPGTGAVDVLAGTSNEGLLDGPAAEAWFAQPSGLAAAGDRLWLADAETSSLRYLEAGAVTTAVGTGLFDFGHVDGPAAQALLQHPLGVTALPDGSVAVERHLQRRGPPVRPGRPARSPRCSPGWPSPATPSCSTATWWSWSRPRTD